MTQDEMVGVAKWAVDVADEHRTTYSKAIQLFKAINRHHEITETKNIIEKGFALGVKGN